MKNKFFFTVVLNTDSTLYLKKISKKFKILNMPKMAKNGPKWPKFGPNTCNFDIFKLEMSQNYEESHTRISNSPQKKDQMNPTGDPLDHVQDELGYQETYTANFF